MVGKLNLLQQLHDYIIIPFTVFKELERLEEKDISINKIKKSEWIHILEPSNREPLNELLAILDIGEAHAIALAIELNADLILLDERKATKIAHDRNLIITSVKEIVDKMINQANFWISADVYQTTLQQANEL